MDDSEDANGVLDLATAAVAPIEQELKHRLAVDVDERDALAIETALLKAFLNGLSTGSADAAEMLSERADTVSALRGAQLTPTAQFDQPLPRIDPWAERYAGNG